MQRIKLTPEFRDRAWQDFYLKNRRVLTLTDGQRRYISRVNERRQERRAASPPRPA